MNEVVLQNAYANITPKICDYCRFMIEDNDALPYWGICTNKNSEHKFQNVHYLDDCEYWEDERIDNE